MMETTEESLSTHPAIVSLDEARDILLTAYGIRAQSVSDLIGYDNRNFLVTDQANGRQLVLKITSLRCTLEGSFIESQVSLLHLLSSRLPGLIQRVIQSLDGSLIVTPSVSSARYPDGHPHKAFLLEYLPGMTLSKAAPFPHQLLHDVGVKFGTLSAVLQHCQDPFLLQRSSHKWDPKNVLLSRAALPHEKCENRKTTFVNFMHFYEREGLPRIETGCREGLIHSDGNTHNILVSHDRKQVTGILDFEDVCCSYLVFECGSLLMYALTGMPEGDFAAIGRAVMTGFHGEQPLTEPEWGALGTAVCARLVQSLLYGLHAASVDPDNQYLLETQRSAWVVLSQILAGDQDKLVASWKSEQTN